MWAYSVLCGLLLAEVNLNTLCQLGKDGATITVMAERTLGSAGSRAVGASYLFLHCAMLVACEPLFVAPSICSLEVRTCHAANCFSVVSFTKLILFGHLWTARLH